MDNLSSHKVPGVHERLVAVGAEVLYLPPTPQTSTPSRRHGPNSNSSCETPRQEQHWRLSMPSPNAFPASALKTRKHGLDSPFTLYSKEKYALAAACDIHNLCPCRELFLLWAASLTSARFDSDALSWLIRGCFEPSGIYIKRSFPSALCGLRMETRRIWRKKFCRERSMPPS
jgi:hypothetical protein